MLDELNTTNMDPVAQHQVLQGMARRSWNPLSSPSTPLSRVAPATPTGSRLGAYNIPTYLPSSRTLRKHDIFDINDVEKHEIRLAFEVFDSRKIGKLCYRDLKAAMRALQFDVKKAEVRKLMHEYSKEDNDEIDPTMMKKYKEKDPEIEIAKAFKIFDEEGKGKVSLKNVRKVVRDLGEAFSEEQLEAMISEFDKDGDGEVTQEEFAELMRRHEPQES